MSEQVTFQYKKSIGAYYSFSARNNVIILPEYIEKLNNSRVREAIQFEAERARYHYVTEVKRLNTFGERVNTFLVKREASKQARSEAQAKFNDVWGEVERTYSKNPNTSSQPSTITTSVDLECDTDLCHANKEVKFTVTVRDSDNLILDITKERRLSRKLSEYID